MGYPFNRSWSHTTGMEIPIAGIDYPRSFGEFQAWFQSDADCLDYLGVAALAVRVCLSGMRPHWRMAAGRREVHVRGL
jgi:hypothetical protein